MKMKSQHRLRLAGKQPGDSSLIVEREEERREKRTEAGGGRDALLHRLEGSENGVEELGDEGGGSVEVDRALGEVALGGNREHLVCGVVDDGLDFLQARKETVSIEVS